MTTRTYTIELEVEVKITSRGHPGRGPSFSSPGDPPESPEFEIETITLTGDPETIEAQYKVFKAAKEKMGLKPTPYDHGHYSNYDQFLADQIYERIMDQAGEDDWSDDGPED